MVVESKLVNPDKQIDCTGLFCPMPIVKTRDAMKHMAVGEVLAMLSDDPASDADMRTWARSTGHDLLEVLLPLGDLREPRGQAARGAEGLDRRPGRDAGLFEARLELFGELTGQARHPRGGELFDADFY